MVGDVLKLFDGVVVDMCWDLVSIDVCFECLFDDGGFCSDGSG